jgi:hypothetical protein
MMTWESLLDQVRRLSGRSRLLWARGKCDREASDSELVSLPIFKSSLLCAAIANAPKRIGAIILEAGAQDPLLLKRYARQVRALASAEGALLIWVGESPAELNNFDVQMDGVWIRAKENESFQEVPA